MAHNEYSKVQYAHVRFLSNLTGGEQLYDYRMIDGVQVGDIVLVSTRHGWSIAQVMSIGDVSGISVIKSIAGILTDTSPVFKRKAAKVKKAALKKEMDERIKQHDYLNRYREYAKVDSTIEQLWNEYNEID